jgi:hypothetical protein
MKNFIAKGGENEVMWGLRIEVFNKKDTLHSVLVVVVTGSLTFLISHSINSSILKIASIYSGEEETKI